MLRKIFKKEVRRVDKVAKGLPDRYWDSTMVVPAINEKKMVRVQAIPRKGNTVGTTCSYVESLESFIAAFGDYALSSIYKQVDINDNFVWLARYED
jgi:hypothetical protein